MNKVLTILLILTAFSACSSKEKSVESPAGYDFSQPIVYEMPEALAEISGIAFYPGRKDLAYAIQDEEGFLFSWKNGNPKELKQVPFGNNGDYEDLGFTKEYAVVLRSNGALIIFPFEEISTGKIQSAKEWKDLIPKGEYESLYVDAEQDDIYILCKNCSEDKRSTAISGYILHLGKDGVPALKSTYKINTQDIKASGSGKKAKLRPSALTWNKQTKEWFVLSSINKLLIIVDETWKVKQAITLNPSQFPQPEGISFDIDNNLYISNEAGNTATGTVLMFPYKAAGR